MTARLAALARGIASLLVLAVATLGPPIALVRVVGWPLPRSVPTLDGLDHAARTGISDQLVVNTLSVLAWLTWAQIAVAIAAELVAVARRRPARRLPVLPGVQAFAARLVTGAFLMTSPLHLTAAPAFALPISTASLAADPAPDTPVPTAALTLLEPPVATAYPLASEGPSVTVGRHDSYWAISERCFNGDGFRWREIRDFNTGRTMPDGTTITADSDLLRPGWTLHLPATATPPDDPIPTQPSPPEPESLAEAAPGEIVVDVGDHFWSIAEDQLAAALGRPPTDAEIDPYWRELIDANTDRLVRPGDPNLLHPGQHLIAPTPTTARTDTAQPSQPAPPEQPAPDPNPAPAAEMPSDDEPPTTAVPPTLPAPVERDAPVPSTAKPVDAPPAPERLAAEGDAAGSPSALPATAIAGTISAALAVGTLRSLRRRRRQASHLHPTLAPRTTSASDQALHRVLILSDDSTLDDLGTAIDQLAIDLAAAGAATRPRVVQHHGSHIEVLLDRPAAPINGWQADGLIWTLDTSDPPHLTTDTRIHAAPLLVTLGQPDDAGQLYLDLEAEGIVSLVGDPAAVEHLVLAIATELALTPLAERVSTLVVGDFNLGAMDGLEHVTTFPSWDHLSGDIAAWTEQTHHAHIANEWPNPFIARGIEPDHDAVATVVVIADQPPPEELLTQLLERRPASVAVVIAADLAQPVTVINCQTDQLTIPALGLTCAPYLIHETTVGSIVHLLDEATEPSTQPLDLTMDTPDGTPGVTDDLADANDGPEAAPEVLVRLLGDIHIDGGDRLAAKPTAVIAYIALHRTVTVERLADAVWALPPAGSRKRLSNTISDCRAALGHRYLPTAVDGRYSAGPGLGTDTDLFTRLVARAATEPASDAVVTLRSALDLVTGPVFTYRHAERASFSWVDLENWASIWELKIAAVAQDCAQLNLDLDRPADAAAVAQHALTIIPTHAGLTETLMRAHAAAGDDHAVRRVYQAHLAALGALDLDDPAETTTDLYEHLRRSSVA